MSYLSSACRQPAKLLDGMGRRKSLSKSAILDKSFQPVCNHSGFFTKQKDDTTTGLDRIFLSDPIVLDLVRVAWNSAADTVTCAGLRPLWSENLRVPQFCKWTHHPHTLRYGATLEHATRFPGLPTLTPTFAELASLACQAEQWRAARERLLDTALLRWGAVLLGCPSPRSRTQKLRLCSSVHLGCTVLRASPSSSRCNVLSPTDRQPCEGGPEELL